MSSTVAEMMAVVARDPADWQAGLALVDACQDDGMPEERAWEHWWAVTRAGITARLMSEAAKLVHERRGGGHYDRGLMLTVDYGPTQVHHPVDILPGYVLPRLVNLAAGRYTSAPLEVSEFRPATVVLFEPQGLELGGSCRLEVGANWVLRMMGRCDREWTPPRPAA